MTNNEEDPFLLMKNWIEAEKALGSINPDRIVLATATKDRIPHSRIVAIREITSQGVIFFTQRKTRKVVELTENPFASMTLWLALQQKQVVLDGIVKPLTAQEKKNYWKANPREQQLRFYSYSETTGQPLPSSSYLYDRLDDLKKQFENKTIPMSDEYSGYHFIAECVYFYTLCSDRFSEVVRYQFLQNVWHKTNLTP